MNACPDCPMCGHPPKPPYSNLCENVNCTVMTWDPDATPAQMREGTANIIDAEAFLNQVFGPCCTAPDCCGPGSYCCVHAGPHKHPEFTLEG